MSKPKARLTLSLLATLAVGLMSTTPSIAQSLISIQGKYMAAKCGGASSNFVKSHGDDQNYDIGNTKLKAVLVNDGSSGQRAGLEVLYTYSNIPKGFKSLLVNFKDDGLARNDVVVHYCFLTEKGIVQAYEESLSDMTIQLTPTRDWSYGTVTAKDFRFGDNNKVKLLKVSFTLPRQGNIQFGDTKIGIVGGNQTWRNIVDVSEEQNCDVLRNCKDVNDR